MLPKNYLWKLVVRNCCWRVHCFGRSQRIINVNRESFYLCLLRHIKDSFGGQQAAVASGSMNVAVPRILKPEMYFPCKSQFQPNLSGPCSKEEKFNLQARSIRSEDLTANALMLPPVIVVIRREWLSYLKTVVINCAGREKPFKKILSDNQGIRRSRSLGSVKGNI